MTRLAIVSTHRLKHQSLDFRFVQRRGDFLDWTCDITKQHLALSDAELAELIRAGDATLYIPQAKQATRATQAVADLSLVPPDQLRTAELRFAYVDALHKSGLAYRAPRQSVDQCIAETAKQLGEEMPNRRSVERWVARAGYPPQLNKLITQNYKKGNRSDRLGPEERRIVEEMIDRYYLQRPPISVSDLLDIIRTEINRRNEDRILDDQLIHVGEDAVRSSIAQRDPMIVEAARYGEKRARAKHDRVDRQKDPRAPLDLVELDHTWADVFVLLPDGTARRPNVGTAVDRCTRMPWGLYIGFEPPSIHTLGQILKNGILPKTYVQKKVTAGEWDIENTWDAWGRPQAIRLDRALENLSEDCRIIAASAGITEIELCEGRRPQQKGAVERFLGNLNRRLLHQQRGTSFSNVIARDDYDPRKNALLSFPDLLFFVHKWLIDIYARKGHGGARDVPYRRWNELTQRYPVEPLSSVREIDSIFGRAEEATLTREGIRFKYVQYISDELIALRRSPEFLASLAAPRRVMFRYDAGDLSEICVYLPHRHEYLRVPCGSYWEETVAGVSVWEHQATIDYVNQVMNSAVDRDALARARTALFERNGLSYGPRSEGIGRYALAGDNTETSPKGRKPRAASDAEPSLADNVVPIRPSKQSRSSRKARGAAPSSKPTRQIPGLIEMED